MLSLRRPSRARIERLLSEQGGLPFSYSEVGGTRESELPVGYRHDRHRVLLGHGEQAWTSARSALASWSMQGMGWLNLCWPDAAIEEGTCVAAVVRAICVWTANPCRIIYVIDEAGDVARFGFAYGTLPDHVERGEERFQIEWHRATDEVWYDVVAFSRPRHPLARLATPITHRMQDRFFRDTLVAMQRATSQASPS